MGARREALRTSLEELPRQTVEDIARRLRVLGHPDRLTLVALLATRSLTVAELAAEAGLDPASASKHLRELYRAGLLVRQQRRTTAIYALTDAAAVKALLLARSVHGQAERRARLLHAVPSVEA